MTAQTQTRTQLVHTRPLFYIDLPEVFIAKPEVLFTNGRTVYLWKVFTRKPMLEEEARDLVKQTAEFVMASYGDDDIVKVVLVSPTKRYVPVTADNLPEVVRAIDAGNYEYLLNFAVPFADGDVIELPDNQYLVDGRLGFPTNAEIFDIVLSRIVERLKELRIRRIPSDFWDFMDMIERLDPELAKLILAFEDGPNAGADYSIVDYLQEEGFEVRE